MKYTKYKSKNQGTNKIYEYFNDKGLEKYREDLPIANFYTKEELRDEIKDLFLNIKEDEDHSTPEEIVDPIHYVIFVSFSSS